LGKPPGGDDVEGPAMLEVMARSFRPPLIDLDPVGQLQLGDGPTEKGGALAHRFDEHAAEIGAPEEYRQGGKAAAAPQIGEAPSVVRKHLEESLGVVNLLAQRARTEESHVLGPFQDSNEGLVTVR
jgi:hypothetical protein